MNWLQKLLLNPNAHIVSAIGTLALGVFAPEVLPIAKAAVAAATQLTGAALLPEQPGHVMLPGPATPIATPDVAPAAIDGPGTVRLPSGASMHADDYAKIFTEVAKIITDAKGRQ